MAGDKLKSFSPQEAAIISESVRQSESIVNKKIENINWLITGVVIVLFIATITMLLTVAGMVIEAWRYNSTIYKESQQLKIQEENIKNTVEYQKLMLETLKEINKNTRR